MQDAQAADAARRPDNRIIVEDRAHPTTNVTQFARDAISPFVNVG
jgi:hypothetical protein